MRITERMGKKKREREREKYREKNLFIPERERESMTHDSKLSCRSGEKL
jgi:hypothetical protein